MGRSFKISPNMLDGLKKNLPQPPTERAHGPLGVSELKKELRSFVGELAACEDMGTLIPLLNGNKDLIEQCKRDFPWWYWTKPGAEQDGLGIEARIEQVKDQLSQKEAAQ